MLNPRSFSRCWQLVIQKIPQHGLIHFSRSLCAEKRISNIKENKDYQIRRLRKEELIQLKEMSNEEGMSCSLTYLEDMFDIDHSNFFCAAHKSTGKVLGTVGLLPLGGMPQNNVFWGCYLRTRKNHRGKGLANLLAEKCLNVAGNVNIGMTSTIPIKGNKERWGSKDYGESIAGYTSTVNQGITDTMMCPYPRGLTIESLDDCSWVDVVKYDRDSICPYDRVKSLELLKLRHHAFNIALLGGQIVGYGCVQNSGQGYYLKPLYADDNTVAQCLLNTLLETIPCHEEVEIQVLEENKEATALFNKYGMLLNKEQTIKMYTKQPIEISNVGKVYSMLDYQLNAV